MHGYLVSVNACACGQETTPTPASSSLIFNSCNCFQKEYMIPNIEITAWMVVSTQLVLLAYGMS